MPSSIDIDAVLRVRRHSPTRLEGFVDASFAFAVTMLVISIGHMPASVPEMLHAFRGMPAFAVSFLMVARIWKAHRDWSRHYDLEDNTAVALSLGLVLVVLGFVYPLRFIFALLFAWISGSFLMDQAIDVANIDEYRIAFEVYGIGFVAIAGLFVLLYRHALRSGASIGLSDGERIATRMHLQLWCLMGAIGILSAISAAMLPFDTQRRWMFMVPGTLYALIGLFAPMIRRANRGRLAALPAPP